MRLNASEWRCAAARFSRRPMGFDDDAQLFNRMASAPLACAELASTARYCRVGAVPGHSLPPALWERRRGYVICCRAAAQQGVNGPVGLNGFFGSIP